MTSTAPLRVAPPPPHVQEPLTEQVADRLHTPRRPRGVRAAGTSTITSTLLGTLREDPRSRAEFTGGRHG